jgi:UDP-3-O-[3-hydroxymyristoyl] N-acetylglucosamine deacetylase/3-hydroxyacyl-[acyl-carrier-protein] dehydratase
MLRETRRQRTIAGPAEVRGVGFFHGADVTIRFHPAEPDTGIVFRRADLPGRPEIPARVDAVVPTPRRTAIGRGGATVEMIEHVMAALAGLQIDNAWVELDAGECPGCDGSSHAYVAALDAAGIVEQDRMRRALVIEESISVREGDAVLAAHPAGSSGRLTLCYHLDYGGDAPIRPQSFSLGLSAESFRTELAASRTFLLEAEASALRRAGIGVRTSASDLLIFGPDGVIGNALRYADECARHKVLDLVGDLALVGLDLHGLVVAYRTGHQTNAALARRLHQRVKAAEAAPPGPPPVPLQDDGTLDIAGIMGLLPHRYPFLLVDRVLELIPARRVVALKNVSVNEPFFRGHWPGRPVMPGVLILEALAQAAGVLIAASVPREGKLALIASIDSVKLRRVVVPGDQLRLEVIGHRIKSNAAVVSGTARLGDAMAAEARIRFVLIDAQRAGRGHPGGVLDQPGSTHGG